MVEKEKELTDQERHVEQYKIKRVLKALEEAKGNGTSMISLIIPPKDQIAKIQKMLTEEYGKAANIKSRVNRQSVLTAITSTRERLKLFNRTPKKGLVLYCGTILSEDGRSEKKYTIDFEPFKPINQFLYYCDNKFHVEPLHQLLEDDDRFGFIVVDGNGTLYGAVQGNARNVLQKFTVDLPKKHGRGGQSAARFRRLREEKRHNYLRKVSEQAVQHFITADKPNCTGLVLAGSANFKVELSQSGMFDPRLASIIIKIVDVSYGMENGFYQAITLSQDSLSNVKFVQERKIISKFFEEIALDTGMIVFGVEDTMRALEIAAIDNMIVWENLDLKRYEFRVPGAEEVKVSYLTVAQETDPKYFKDPETNLEYEILNEININEW